MVVHVLKKVNRGHVNPSCKCGGVESGCRICLSVRPGYDGSRDQMISDMRVGKCSCSLGID
jgi:hypothetical protein